MRITMLKRSSKLWNLLDDIDTASDRFKPETKADYVKFYEYTMRKVEQRHEVLKSDGRRLYLPWFWRLLVWLGIKG